MFGFGKIFAFVEAVVKFVRVWGKLAVVVGPALAAFWYSPWFKQFFIGIAVGAAVMFGVQYTEIFAGTGVPLCINPNHVPGGPVAQCWVPSDPTDARDIYGHYENCHE